MLLTSTGVKITLEQKKFVDESCLNLSKFLRNKLNEIMESHNVKDSNHEQ